MPVLSARSGVRGTAPQAANGCLSRLILSSILLSTRSLEIGIREL
jgi:hypothetical protein